MCLERHIMWKVGVETKKVEIPPRPPRPKKKEAKVNFVKKKKRKGKKVERKVVRKKIKRYNK